MTYLETYLSTIRTAGNKELAESIRHTAEDVGHARLEQFDFVSPQVGLLLGNVQSGKTGQMFGIMCEAADLGFPVFLLLTTDNTVLQDQTLERVRHDLPEFCICGENDERLFVDNNLEKPTVVVLKKNARILKLWDTVFGSTDFMLGNPLFIVDDEADAASLNTKVNQRQVSSINKYLSSIKNRASSSLYLQVTGTPQALLLQAKTAGWHPLFTYYFRPGQGYLGGDFFFPQGTPPACIQILDCKESEAQVLRDAVLHHLISSAQLLLAGCPVCNFMIHPSVRVAAHNKYEKQVREILDLLRQDCDTSTFQAEIFEAVRNIQPKKTKPQQPEAVLAFVQRLLKDKQVGIYILNGKSETEAKDYATGSNIIIGGNTLGRGVTFGGLATVYYTRSSKKPQADTMWQHSRMFGYDRDPGLVRVYLEQRLYDLFADINTTNNAIIAQIERGVENIHLYFPEGLNPTRINVLDHRKTNIIPGGRNFFPQTVDNDTIEAIDQLLEPFEDTKEFYPVNLRIIKEVLKHIQVEDFPLTAFVGFLDIFLAERAGTQGVLIVRRERDIQRGGRALLSPNDWNIGEAVQDKVVLTMYKMTGQKGWNGRKVWVPNIKLPGNAAYYDVEG